MAIATALDRSMKQRNGGKTAQIRFQCINALPDGNEKTKLLMELLNGPLKNVDTNASQGSQDLSSNICTGIASDGRNVQATASTASNAITLDGNTVEIDSIESNSTRIPHEHRVSVHYLLN